MPQINPNVLFSGSSDHNANIVVYQVPGGTCGVPAFLDNAIVLALDKTGAVHSVYNPARLLTGVYWDCLASMAGLPCLDSSLPIGLLGMGSGTVA